MARTMNDEEMTEFVGWVDMCSRNRIFTCRKTR